MNTLREKGEGVPLRENHKLLRVPEWHRTACRRAYEGLSARSLLYPWWLCRPGSRTKHPAAIPDHPDDTGYCNRAEISDNTHHPDLAYYTEHAGLAGHTDNPWYHPSNPRHLPRNNKPLHHGYDRRHEGKLEHPAPSD